MLAVILLGLGVGCGADERASQPTPRPSAASLEANDGVLDDLDPYPGASALGRNDVEPPKGGRGATSYLYFAVDADRTAIIEHFALELEGWTPVRSDSLPTRTTAEFVRGTRWVSITASDVAGPTDPTPVPGYVLVVNATDAHVLTSKK